MRSRLFLEVGNNSGPTVLGYWELSKRRTICVSKQTSESVLCAFISIHWTMTFSHGATHILFGDVDLDWTMLYSHGVTHILFGDVLLSLIEPYHFVHIQNNFSLSYNHSFVQNQKIYFICIHFVLLISVVRIKLC